MPWKNRGVGKYLTWGGEKHIFLEERGLKHVFDLILNVISARLFTFFYFILIYYIKKPDLFVICNNFEDKFQVM